MPRPPRPEPLVRPPRRRIPWRTVAAGIVLHPACRRRRLAPAAHPREPRGAGLRPLPAQRRAPPRGHASRSIVDIDEESLSRYGQWPWPRYRVALLLDRVRELGAAAVALDMVFAEPDRTSLPLIAREIERDLGVAVASRDPAVAAADNDRLLAEALGQGPFVLGYAFGFGSGAPPPATACCTRSRPG